MQERIPTTPVKKLDRKDVTSVAQGFLEATNVGTFNFTALLECIYEADQDAEILDAVVHMLEDAYKNKDWQEGIGAIIGTVAFVQGVEQTIPICKAVDTTSANWTTFHNIVETLESPEKHMTVIGENVVLNGKTITSELAHALDAWRSGDYFSFGQNLGATLKDTCEKDETLFLY